jgi:hypothetical protein
MLGLFKLFSSSKEPKYVNKDLLKMLWLSDRPDWVMDIIAQMTKDNEEIPSIFMTCIIPYSSELVKRLLIAYPQPKWNVCLQVSKLLVENTPTATVCANAIGTEHAKYNKEFYHKLRVLKGMEMGQWRKFLALLRGEKLDVVKAKSKPYTLGLFNEPFGTSKKILGNPSIDNDILSLYKGHVYRNRIMRVPVEIELDDEFKQADFHGFASGMIDESLVIITKHIGEGVIPPKNVYLVFIESSKSFSERILPYFEEASHNLFAY